MNKGTQVNLITAIIIILFIGIAYIFLGWYFEINDFNCLEEKAKDYCIAENFEGAETLSGLETISFYCYSQSGDERKGFENETEKFYFTEEETKECLSKEMYSWRKIK